MIDTSPDRFSYRPFPTGVLPDPVKRFILETARAIGCDDSFIALPALAALASSIGNTRRIRLKSTWTEPPILWTTVVAPSGTVKSPAFRQALKYLHGMQSVAMTRHSEAMELHEAELLVYDVDLSSWKSKGKKVGEQPPTKPQPPTARRYVVNDVTVEAIAPILCDNPRGLLIARDELSGWFGSFDAYRGGRGGDSAKWIELFHAQPLTIDRKGNARVIHVPNASVCVTGTIQPDTLRRALVQEHFDSGLAARLLMAMPPRRIAKWTDAESSAEADAAMVQLFQDLLALEFHSSPSGELLPVELPLTDKGRLLWIKFYNEQAESQAMLSGDMAAACSKLTGYCARLALVIHMIRVVAGDPHLKDPDSVDEESIVCAMQLVQWFGDETSRIYSVLRESDAQRETRQLIELIQSKGGSVTVRELQRSRSKYPTAQDARHELQALAGLDFGRFVSESAGESGGRSSEVFRIHDAYLDDNTQLQRALAEPNGGSVSSVSVITEDKGTAA